VAKLYRRFESLSPPRSLKCRKIHLTFPEIFGKRPPICDFLPINRTGENVRPLLPCVYSLHFLCLANWWFGFAILGWRKQCDQKPIIRRRRLDFIRVFLVASILRETVTQAFLSTLKFPTSRLLDRQDMSEETSRVAATKLSSTGRVQAPLRELSSIPMQPFRTTLFNCGKTVSTLAVGPRSSAHRHRVTREISLCDRCECSILLITNNIPGGLCRV
jgi:hypothetical protein